VTVDAASLLVRRFEESWTDPLLTDPAGCRLSYGQVWVNAARLAAEWRNAGVAKGDRVALVLGNHIAFPCCYLACMIGGFIAVPVNPELSDSDVAHILELARPGIVLRSPPAIDDRSLLARSQLKLAGDSRDVAAIFFTSGTTGLPKGVQHSLDALVGNVVSFNAAMGLGRDTHMYHVLPMAYMAGFLNTLLSPIMAGGRVVIGRRFSAETALDFWTLAIAEGANTSWLTPTIAATLCRLARDKDTAPAMVRGFRTILCGTAPLHPNVRRDFVATFAVPLQESYGTSELLLVSAQNPADAAASAEHVGAPLHELILSFRTDSEGRRELMVTSPYAMLGYLTAEELTTPVTVEGAMPTGDIAELKSGSLHITGRIKDLIIRGGVNVAPQAIENVLRDVPGVLDIAVIGRPHSFWGETIVVCVEADRSVDPTTLETAIRQRCQTSLARPYRPDEISILDSLPRGTTGKIQKHLLRQSVEH
jgi:acyl-CoA synthetase (AMP-forming)/AMP-acid ligase II